MSIEDSIPDRVFLHPMTKSLPTSKAYTDEDGNLHKQEDIGYTWVVSEKDPGKCNPEFVNIQRLWHKPSEKPKPIKKGMPAVGCFVRYKSGAFEFAEYWFAPFNHWQDPVFNEDINLELIDSWCYITDLLPKEKYASSDIEVKTSKRS